MSNDGQNPPAEAGDDSATRESGAAADSSVQDQRAYARPEGVEGGFAAPSRPPRLAGPSGPAPSVGEQQVFGRPGNVEGSFVQRPGSAPVRRPAPAPPQPVAQAFGRPAGTVDSFAPRAPFADRQYTQDSPPLAYQRAFGRPADDAADLQRQPGRPPFASAALPSKTWWEEAPRDPWRDPHAEAGLQRAPRLAEHDDLEAEAVVQTDKKRRRRIRLGDIPIRIAAFVAAMTIVLGVAGGIGGYYLGKATSQTPLTTAEPAYNDVDNSKPPSTIGEIVQKVQPSVVSIEVYVGNSGALGSGVVIAEDGYIVTNNHVIAMAGSAEDATVNVHFSDESVSPAQIVGRDPQADIAVLKVDKPGLVPIDIGKSENVAVGDEVLAFGSPLGLAGTVTSGIVSALDRPLHLSGEGGEGDVFFLALQTDASINHGNSGGALVDSQGALVGINTAGLTAGQAEGSIGLGFAIPVDYAMSIADTLIKGDTPQHGSLGINAESVTDGTSSGVLVVRADAGSPAADAGIKEKDVITEVDGVHVTSVEDLNAVTYAKEPGDTVTVTLISGGEQKTLEVVLGEA